MGNGSNLKLGSSLTVLAPDSNFTNARTDKWVRLGIAGLWLLCLFILPTLLYLFLRERFVPTAHLLANLFCFWTFQILTVLPHELAHAIVGRRLGLFVTEVSVGRGREIFSMTLLNLQIAFRAVPFFGLVRFRHILGPRLRAKYFVTVLAGPLTHLLLAALVFPFVNWNLDFINDLAIGQWFVFSQVLLAFANLLPFPTKAAPSDGLSLLQLLFSKYPDVLGFPHQFNLNCSTNSFKAAPTSTITASSSLPSSKSQA